MTPLSKHENPDPPADDAQAFLDRLHPAARLWLKPMEEPLAMVLASSGKTLGELTMPEVMAWGLVMGYALLSGVIAGRLAANVAVTVLRGPVIRR